VAYLRKWFVLGPLGILSKVGEKSDGG
jgi:hypothetical protein